MNDIQKDLENYLHKITSGEAQASQQPVIDPKQAEQLRNMEQSQIDRINNESPFLSMDLTPLYQMADMLGNGTSNLAAGYRAPTSKEQRIAEARSAYKRPQQGSAPSPSNELLKMVNAAKGIDSLKDKGPDPIEQAKVDYYNARTDALKGKSFSGRTRSSGGGTRSSGGGTMDDQPSDYINPYKLSKGQEVVDKEFAKIYAEDFIGGKINEATSNVGSITDVIENFNSGKNLTGAWTALPGRSVWSPESRDAQQTVENVIMGSLRTTLGAQFTEKEGTRVLEAVYNPKLPEHLIAKRLERLQSKLKAIIEDRKAAGNYFQKNETLKGFDAVGGLKFNPGRGLADELISNITFEGKEAQKKSNQEQGRQKKEKSNTLLDEEMSELEQLEAEFGEI